MAEPKIVFLYGPPAAGKTTFAKCYVAQPGNESFMRIGADDVRRELYGSPDCYGVPEDVFHAILVKMAAALSDGKSVLYDAVNMKKQYRLDFLKVLKSVPYRKEIIMLPTSQEVCMARHKTRHRDFSLSDVAGYFYIQEPPTVEEGWDGIYTCCSTAYVASPFFSDDNRANAVKAAEILRSKGIETYLPLEHKIKNAWDYSNQEWGKKVFEADIAAIQRADIPWWYSAMAVNPPLELILKPDMPMASESACSLSKCRRFLS